MQLPGSFTRKYAIMEELDSGFSSGSTPEAFVRLDSWEGSIQASVHVKGLKQGPFQYKLYLIFDREGKLIPLLAGAMNVSYSGMQSGLEISADILKENGVRPDSVRYAAIVAEDRDRKWIPLFSSFEKNFKWDESIRQVLFRKPYAPSVESKQLTEPAAEAVMDKKADVAESSVPEEKTAPIQTGNVTGNEKLSGLDGSVLPVTGNVADNAVTPLTEGKKETTSLPEDNTANKAVPVSGSKEKGIEKPKAFPADNSLYKCDINKLENLLQNSFESYVPFKRSHKGYSWYRVSDLSKLSNIMYLSGVNVPVFANPKILVGLFRYKHILAGLYRGENGRNYYVIGVPAKNEKDNRPFESACRWVPLKDSDVRDMGGYWMVYVSLKTGEIVV